MQQVHLLISGFVQGVGYREFVKRESRKIGLVGWVRNLSDRRVEIVAQGTESQLKDLIKRCEKGSFLSEVKNMSIEWQEQIEKFSEFKRLPTE
jgi:acylphosphatase